MLGSPDTAGFLGHFFLLNNVHRHKGHSAMNAIEKCEYCNREMLI